MKGSAINHADVLIIGGASAAVAVKHLAEPGPYVMCLEAGEWSDRATFPGTQQDWELSGLKQWSADPPMFAGRPGDYPIDVTDSDMSIMNFNGGGGTTVSVGGVRELMGYPGQQARPVMPEGFPAYIAEGLLDHLVGR
jgi:choline dehydrogenase-like flavoprotein